MKRYGDDAVFGLMDLSVETQAVGSRVRFRDGAYPTVERYALKPVANLDTLALPNPRESGRMPELLKALRVFRRAVGDDVLVSGCVAGPMTLTTQLFGIETALYLAVDDPEGFERVLDFSVEVAQVFGRAQVEAGAHVVLVFDPSASPEVVPPALFRELLLPRFKKVFSALDDAGSRARWLSITGGIDPLLKWMSREWVDLVNLDYPVDPVQAAAHLGRLCVDGNLKPMDFVVSDPETIHAQGRRLCEGLRDRGGFILSSGCEIPLDASPDNILAMVEAAKGGE